MAGQQIAQYYAKVGIMPDMVQFKKIDAYLKQIENKLRAFQNRLSKKNGALNINFNFNTNRLQFDVQKAFLEVSRKVRFPVDNFVVNKQNLVGQVSSAIRQAISQANKSFTLFPKVGRVAASVSGDRSPASYSRANFLHAGGGAGALARYGVQSLPFIGGVYGIGQLNRSNQELISGQLTTQAVLAAKGYSTQEGIQANQWLMNLADDVGFNYMQALPDYNQFLSNALGAGLGVRQSQDIFQGFSEYQTAMGVTPARRKLVQNALSQMLGKGVLSMEEVRRQMAESMPGTMDVFAQAYSEMTGSGLQGQEALAKFYDDIAKGGIKSADILPIVARILSERAAPKLDVMKKSSIAEQARAENAQIRLLETFSKSGGEEGFARFWRETAKIFKEMKPLVEGLGGAFNDLTRIMQPLRMVFEGWNNILETTSELTGLSKTRLLELAAVGGLMASKWGRVATMFTSILLVMEDFAFGMSGKDSYTKDFLDFLQSEGLSSGQAKFAAIAAALTAVATALALISRNSMLPGIGDILGGGKGGKSGGIGKGGAGLGSKIIPTTKALLPLAVAGGVVAAAGSIGGDDSAWSRMNTMAELRQMGQNPLSPFYKNPQLLKTVNSEMHNPSSSYYGRDPAEVEAWLAQNARQNTIDRLLMNQQKYGNMLPGVLKMEVSVEANITAENAEDFAQKFEGKLNEHLKNTLLNFGYTGGSS